MAVLYASAESEFIVSITRSILNGDVGTSTPKLASWRHSYPAGHGADVLGTKSANGGATTPVGLVGWGVLLY